MILSKDELNILLNKDFLITKSKLIKDIYSLFEKTRKELLNTITISNLTIPDYVDISTGKIFRGEDYKSLPYVNLDFPKYFKGNNVFTYRTMFWWGNFFSFTLHLQGEPLNIYRNNLLNNFSKLLNKNIFICVNETPWEYDYSNENYEIINESHKYLFEEKSFIKLSKKIEISDHDKVIETSSSFLFFLLNSILSR